MTKMMAHNPETDDLVVIGTSQAAALKQRSEAPLHLNDVIERLSQTNPEACARYVEAASTRKQQEVEGASAALQVPKPYNFHLHTSKHSIFHTATALNFGTTRRIGLEPRSRQVCLADLAKANVPPTVERCYGMCTVPLR